MSSDTKAVASNKPTLAELRKAVADKEEAHKQAADEREVEALTLVLKYEAELGQRGVAFEVVTTDVGVFAVKAPDYTTAKRFNAIPAEKRGDEEVAHFVSPCVLYPDQGAFRGVIQGHGGVAWRLCVALLGMYEGSAVGKVGKF